MITLDEFQARDRAVGNMERALIATVLANPDQIQHAELLLPQDFAHPSHQAIWSEILAFHRDGQLSLQATYHSLDAKGLLPTLGSEFGDKTGIGYFNETLSYAAPQSTDFFAKSVLNFATQRAVKRSAALLAADCDDPNLDADELLDKAESMILEMRRNRGRQGTPIGTILDLFHTVVEQRRANTYVPALWPHIAPIRRILGFFESTDYAIYAARPGESKSSILRYEACKEAIDGRPATILNLENGELEYARHLISLETGIDNRLLRAPTGLTETQLQEVKDAIGRLKGIPLRIVTMGGPNAEEVAREYLEAVRIGAKSVWLDYIQLVNNRVNDRNTDVTITSTRLRGLALKHQVPLIVASQMSRNITNRGIDAEPELSDLRDSGSLEQDSTHVLFPRLAWGPAPSETQLQQFEENRHGEIVVAPLRVYIRKNRNGPIGISSTIKWNRATNDFSDLDAERSAQRPGSRRTPSRPVPVQQEMEEV